MMRTFMLWLLNSNRTETQSFQNLIEILERFEIDYQKVKPIPFTLNFYSEDYDSFDKEAVSVEPYIDTSRNIFVCGSYTLCKIAKDRGWFPGAFMNENFSYDLWINHYGKENLLNGNSIISSFENLNISLIEGERIFARPLEDTKSFNGGIFLKEDLIILRERILEFNQLDDPLNKDKKILVSKPIKILREYRLFIVDGIVITGSLYKLGNRVLYDSVVENEIISFAYRMIEKWVPDRAFVMDIAMLEDNSLKIVEINGINSAGFYASDLQKFVFAIENMKF